MGLFDFFKKRQPNQSNDGSRPNKLPKSEAEDLILVALNLLCDDKSTLEDAEKLIMSKGYDEKQASIMAGKANALYMKHFANKKKDENLFNRIKIYNEYIVRFVGMQRQGNYAPIAAYVKSNGELVGFLYVMGDNNSYSLSAREVIERMESSLKQKLESNDICSYVILYHSQFADDNNHKLANNESELKAISVSYNFRNETIGKIGLPYIFENDEITYKGFVNFDQEENNTIFSTQIDVNKDYFQDRVEMKAPVYENEIGLQIKKANIHDLCNTWCGIFGFESYRNPTGAQVLDEHFAIAMYKGKRFNRDNLKIDQLEYQDIILKAIFENDNPVTIIPVLKTDKIVNVENSEICEWENINNLEAIISGKGKDTFGIWYFATDYAEKRNRYLSEKKLNIKLSGIAFVLDTHNEKYTAYLPSKDLPGYACFDFLGVLLDFRETSLLEGEVHKGFILRVKLITDPDIEDFFSLDIFVTQENMRFEGLTKGMKISGLFQMQGQIAD